jgi:hypothetical protein
MISVRIAIVLSTLVNDIKIVLEREGHNVVLKGVSKLEILVHLVCEVIALAFLVVAVVLVVVLLLADVDALEEVEEGIALDYHRLLLGALALLLLGVGHVAARQPRDGGAHAAVNYVLLAHIEGLFQRRFFEVRVLLEVESQVEPVPLLVQVQGDVLKIPENGTIFFEDHLFDFIDV